MHTTPTPTEVNWNSFLTDRDPQAHAASWSTGHAIATDPPECPPDCPDECPTHGHPSGVCRHCKGLHSTQRCPDVLARLFAPETPPWKDVALGRELCRMRWHNFKAFVALLLSVPAAHLGIYAESYVAFIRDHDQDTTLTTMDVLKVWTRIMTTAPSMQAA